MQAFTRDERQDLSGPLQLIHGTPGVGHSAQFVAGYGWPVPRIYALGQCAHRGLCLAQTGVGRKRAPHSGNFPSAMFTRSRVTSSRTFLAAQSSVRASMAGPHSDMPAFASFVIRSIKSASFAAAQVSSFISGSFSVGPSRKAADLGASEFVGGAGRTQQKGELICTQHAFSFPQRQLVSQPVSRLDFAMAPPADALGRRHPTHRFVKALMDSLSLPLLGRLNAPSVVPTAHVTRCKTFREAVRLAWALRRVHYMTLRQLAIDGGFYPQHVGDWLNPDDKPTRRSLPAECIARFEVVVGNTLCSQWLAHRSALTVLEEMQASRALA